MTDNVISLAEHRSAVAAPEPDCIRQDDHGRPLYCFLVDYESEGRRYSAKLWAYDLEGAERLVADLRATARVAGQLFGKVPA